VTVTLSGDETATTTTDGSGNYSFTGLANGAYTVTPSLAGYSFSPTNFAVTLSGADSTGNDFVSTFTISSISGTVAGTEIIAVNDSGEVVASDNTAGRTPNASGSYPFTLTSIPMSVNIQVYLITGSGVYPMYFDSNSDGIPDTNVFSSSAVVEIDLGFVDTAVAGQSGRAIPDNNPSDIVGVSAQVENTAVPATASLVGTWGFGRLKHRNNGTWAARSGKFTYNADGTGSRTWQESDNGNLTSGADTWTWTAITNPNGSITVTRTFTTGTIKTSGIVISDDGMVMIRDGTNILDKQRFRVAVRMNTAQTYTNADLSKNYYLNGYDAGWDTDLFYNEAGAGTLTSNAAGNFTMTITSNRNGSISESSTSTGNSTITDGSMLTGSDGKLIVEAASRAVRDWDIIFFMKKADRTYTTADLTGTWAFMSFQDNNGTSYAAAFGTLVCDTSGNCTVAEKRQTDGILTIQNSGPYTYAVQADGSFGASIGTSTPAYAGAIGNNGNVMVINPSFEDSTIRKTVIGVRCSTCAGLENGGPWLTQLTNDSAADSAPDWNADGTRIVFKSDRLGNSDIWIMDADGDSQTQLTTTPENEGHPHFSSDGSQIVFWSERTGNREVWTMKSDGSKQTQITNNTADDGGGAWNPDGTQIVFRSDRAGNNDVWLMNADGTNLTQLTTNTASDGAPQFSPDGTQIVFSSDRTGNGDIWIMNADGSNPIQLTTNSASDRRPHFSYDGTQIVFHSNRSRNNDVWVMNSDGTAKTRITTLSANDNSGDFSPDGKQIVFQSDRSGNQEIWTYTLP
ncbi:MAG TPA: hypothetical protein ENI62_04515, partial [Gammaproteobacteria bacterium]|nr:hypothetical protein [Gammaproteobacteria bacterium]